MPDSKLISTDHLLVNRDGATYKTTVEEIQNFVGSGGSKVIVSDTAPDPVSESLEEGTLWWDSAEGDLFVLYNDSTDPSVPNLIWVDSNTTTILDDGTTGDEYVLKSDFDTEKEEKDAAIESLTNGVVELEEELEALAPTLQRGNWEYNLSVGTGKFALYDENAQSMNKFNDVDSIYVSKFDNTGTAQGFSNITVGSYVEIFVNNSPNFGLYLITGISDFSSNPTPYWVFTVELVKTNNVLSTATGPCRFKFFEISGGDVTTLLSKYGEEVIDAVGPVNYKWNQPTELRVDETNQKLSLASGPGSISIRQDSDGDAIVDVRAFDVRFTGDAVHFDTSYQVVFDGAGEALLKKTIRSDTDKDHIVNKKYVDDSLDFSTYPPLEA